MLNGLTSDVSLQEPSHEIYRILPSRKSWRRAQKTVGVAEAHRQSTPPLLNMRFITCESHLRQTNTSGCANLRNFSPTFDGERSAIPTSELGTPE